MSRMRALARPSPKGLSTRERRKYSVSSSSKSTVSATIRSGSVPVRRAVPVARVLVDAQRLTESEATRLMMEAAQPLMLADSSAQAEDYQAALDNRSLQMLMRSRLRTLRR